jgi:hypothetical protein
LYRAEEIATQQFNAAKKEQTVVEQNKGSFFKRKRLQNHRRSKSLGKVRFPHKPAHCNENPIYEFLFWELRGLSPNFHIRASVSDLYIPRTYFLQLSWQIDRGNI